MNPMMINFLNASKPTQSILNKPALTVMALLVVKGGGQGLQRLRELGADRRVLRQAAPGSRKQK